MSGLRRLLLFASCALAGTGLLILLSAGTGAGLPFGIGFCALLVVGGAVGGRWGPGPVSRGVRAPQLARAGVGLLALCALAGGWLLWRPEVGDGMPLWRFLLFMAAAAILMVPVGLMGRDQEAETPPATPDQARS